MFKDIFGVGRRKEIERKKFQILKISFDFLELFGKKTRRLFTGCMESTKACYIVKNRFEPSL